MSEDTVALEPGMARKALLSERVRRPEFEQDPPAWNLSCLLRLLRVRSHRTPDDSGTDTQPETIQSSTLYSRWLRIDRVMRVLRDTDGKEAAVNEEDMLQLHGPAMFNKYYDGDPEATADGWFITGDSAYLDEQPALHHWAHHGHAARLQAHRQAQRQPPTSDMEQTRKLLAPRSGFWVCRAHARNEGEAGRGGVECQLVVLGEADQQRFQVLGLERVELTHVTDVTHGSCKAAGAFMPSGQMNCVVDVFWRRAVVDGNGSEGGMA
ncbi:uncharacterized protein TRUGW13939_10921 [Talaromyces rugulosus]|uniref:Uncharacterized protein n=1 Tax=Talaromyces rugulosus TaxID=121627 RepID=A0A7H8RBE2_TALRU|nr:uncharacterized protein TRUGW13939_10921 [Talaromyces rugulosus]QKX63750.1 hypothetical protein TRUGW13939_10921 [Talaromyces rugulosus]